MPTMVYIKMTLYNNAQNIRESADNQNKTVQPEFAWWH